MVNISAFISIIFDISITLIENYLVISILELFFIKKRNFTIAFSLFLSFISTLLNTVIYPPIYASGVLLICLYVYAFLFLDGNKKLKVLLPTILFGNLFIINSFSIYFMSMLDISLKQTILSSNINDYVFSISSKIILFLEYRYLNKFKNNCLYINSNIGIYILFLLLISMLFPQITLSIYLKGEVINKLLVLVSLAQFFLINIFAYIILNIMNSEHNKILEKEIMLETEKNQYQFITLIEDQIKEKVDMMNKLNHDMKNHKIVIQKMINNLDDNSNINNYINELFGDDISYISTDNNAINYIINEKIKNSQKYNIDFKCIIQGNLKESISTTDLTIVIGNLLDNAIEASLKTNDRHIQIKIIKDDYKLVISVSNTYNGTILEKKGNIISTKKDKNKHGYGISNIKLICNKYHGSSYIEYSSNMFYHTCVFLLDTFK